MVPLLRIREQTKAEPPLYKRRHCWPRRKPMCSVVAPARNRTKSGLWDTTASAYDARSPMHSYVDVTITVTAAGLDSA